MSDVYSYNDWRDYEALKHHGILGQKWYVKNGPPYPLDAEDHNASEKKAGWEDSLNKLPSRKYSDWYSGNESLAISRINKARSVNLDKWGKSKNTNILYVTGLSGSGKSTAAGYLADKNKAELINLDSYLSPMSKESKRQLQNKSFNKYLNETVPDWKNAIKPDYKLDFRIVDDIAKASEEFGKTSFDNNKRVIVEGVQVLDNTLYADNSSYRGKPVMVISTNQFSSNLKGSMRDSENIFDTADLVLTRIGVSNRMNNQLKKFKKELKIE